MKQLLPFLFVLSLAACSTPDPAPTASDTPIDIPLATPSPEPLPTPSELMHDACWELPNAKAPKEAQKYKRGVFCESDNGHHSSCARCPKVK